MEKLVKYPIQLLYTSVIPAIFIYALIIELQSLFGFNPNNPIVQLLSPPNLIINIGQFGIDYLYVPFNIFHIIFYFYYLQLAECLYLNSGYILQV